MTEILSLFKEPGGAAKLLCAGFFNAVPGLGIFFWGYCGEYARSALEAGEIQLPEWRGLKRLFIPGVRVAVLLIVVFSPSLASGAAGLLLLGLPSHGDSFLYFGHSLGALFFSLVASLAGILVFFGWPICFFRFVESGEMLWAVQIKGVLQDIAGMGMTYWRDWIEFITIFFFGDLVCAGIALAISFSLGIIFGAALFWLLTSTLSTCMFLGYIKMNAGIFKELPYRY